MSASSTQLPPATSHTSDAQLEPVSHATHSCEALAHIGALAGHDALVMHAPQEPSGSHNGCAASAAQSLLLVHDVVHVWPMQNGVVPPQSAAVLQSPTTHVPVVSQTLPLAHG